MPKVKINLEKFLLAQKKLDADIHTKKNLQLSQTIDTRKLGLIVELYECINETKVFKFWSSSTPDKKKLITEYVDVLHFTLSLILSYELKIDELWFDEEETKDDAFLLVLFLDLSGKITELLNKERFLEWVNQFFQLGSYLGFKYHEIEEYYFQKLDINYQRQLNNY